MVIRYAAILFFLLSIAAPLQARLGEFRNAIEQRLLSDRRALRFPTDEVDARSNQNFTDYRNLAALLKFEYVDNETHSAEMRAFLARMDREIKDIASKLKFSLYYKPYDKSQASRSDIEEEKKDEGKAGAKGKKAPNLKTPNGWLLFVIYANNISVYESYKKVGAGIIQAEKDYLLATNKGSSFWKEADGNEEITESFFGMSAYRDDGQLRTDMRGSNTVSIFDANFDKQLAQKRAYLNSSKERVALENIETSVGGF